MMKIDSHEIDAAWYRVYLPSCRNYHTGR